MVAAEFAANTIAGYWCLLTNAILLIQEDLTFQDDHSKFPAATFAINFVETLAETFTKVLKAILAIFLTDLKFQSYDKLCI